MPLTSEEMEKILVDMETGKPPRVTGPEADEFRAKLATDIEKIRAAGMDVEVPSEWPSMD